MNVATLAERRPRRWLSAVAWLIPIVGIAVASTISATLAVRLLYLPFNDVMEMEQELALSSLVATLFVLAVYRVGWSYQRSLNGKLLLTTVLVGIITLYNGYIAAELMFVEQQQVIVVAILLVFATIVSTAFGAFGFSRVSRHLRTLADGTRQVAEGDLSVRVPVEGHDEVAQVSRAFNEMTRQLEVAAREREEIEKLRRDLIAWVSHDLRTPLTSIRVMVEALNDGVVDDEATVARYYKTIRADVIALNRLIDDLFELAQLDAGGMTLELMTGSLSDLISDTVDMFRPVAQRRGITVRGDIADGLDPVTMNAEKIGRVLANLIGNALKYAPDNGRIIVSARRDADGVLVSVRDSGPGFVAADLPRVFEKFYRGEGARSRSDGSSAGLGLSIARGIVQAHGGAIWAENDPRGGARVTFRLP